MVTRTSNSLSKKVVRPAISVLALLLPVVIASSVSGINLAAQPAQSDQSLSGKEIIDHIDAAVFSRSSALAGYSVQEVYSIFRNGETSPSAQETVRTTYIPASGKQYAVVSQSGSGILRSAIIDKVLVGEKEMSATANREGVWVTSANYEMRPEPTQVEISGRKCLIVDLRPRRKSPHLCVGKAWVDASDFTVVRLAGTPSQIPSFFAGETTVLRDYDKVAGISMATHAEAHSHSLLLGDTLLKIDYTDYKIDLDPSAAQIPTPTRPTEQKLQ